MLASASIAGLVLVGLRVIGGHGGKPSSWTSNAKFTISEAGTYTAAV